MIVSVILVAQIAVVSIAVAVAVLHLALSFRHDAKTLHRFFALVALSSAGEAAASAWRYRASTPQELVSGARWGLTAQYVFVVAICWFVTVYTDRPRGRFIKAFTAYAVVVAVVNFAAPFGVLFQELPTLSTVWLSWGEPITVPVAKRSPLMIVMNLLAFATAYYLVSSCIRLWRQGDSRRAKPLALALVPLVAIAYPQGLMINWGLLTPPYLYSYAFLAMVMLMSFNLIGEAVQVGALSRKIAVSEGRWRIFLENVKLLAAGFDREGRFNYVNPHFLRATGYSTDELLGRPFLTILPTTEAPRLARLYRRVVDGLDLVEPHSASIILRKDGVQRTIEWSNVPVFDDGGAITGMLSVGADTTDREQAEAARDSALHELEEIRRRLEAENLYLKEEVFAGPNASEMIGQSVSIRYVLHKIKEVAGTNATVLIQGETGVGKELVARAIHKGSARASAPYIRVSCAALPATLIESELFGHEKGSFTGADKLRRGRFELADGGTLLLDEVGELPLDVQVKLLRVLQEGEFERVGSAETRKANVRIIAATNRHLGQEVSAGRFREDLYYRLQVYPITVPPLRDRREDIPLLVERFTQRFAKRYGKAITEIPGHVLKLAEEWNWPGNVRELENVIERAVISSTGHTLRLPRDFGFVPSQLESPSMDAFLPLAEMEQNHIQRALKLTHGKIAGRGGAAELLQMHPNTLRTRMEKFGIERYPS